jgi:hypothetical protein
MREAKRWHVFGYTVFVTQPGRSLRDGNESQRNLLALRDFQ